MAKATFKDWKNTGGERAMEKDLIKVVKKNRNKYIALSFVFWVGPIIWGAKAIVCMDTVRELEHKGGIGLVAGLYRLFIRVNSFFIELILEHMIYQSEEKVQKVCGVYEMLHK